MNKKLEIQEKIEHIKGMTQEHIFNDFLDNEGLEESDLYDLSINELEEFERNYQMYINEWGI